MKAYISILGLLAICLSTPSRTAAQDQSCAQRLLPISLVGPDASFLHGFTVSDIALKFRPPVLQILSVQPDARIRGVVILLDVSSSMAGRSSQSWKVVTEFVSHIAGVDAKNTQFALILFSDHILETIDFSHDSGAVHRRIAEISHDHEFSKRDVGGRTALFDALKTGFHLIDAPTSADSLFVITDGEDNRSKTQPNEILTMLSPSMVRIFALLLQHGTDRNRTLEEASSREDFHSLVHSSGGGVFGPVTVDELGHSSIGNPYLANRPLSDSLLEFYRSMLQNSVLTLQGTPASNSSTLLDIALSKEGRNHWKNASVLYPHQIIACPPAAD